MVAIGISEFTFGYAFLHEQTRLNWGGLKAAPILPSLQQEQEQGWDAHLPTIGTDFYYQFKLTEYLSRPNASFIADGTYSSPYYRLGFHRKNNNQQHQRLRDHSKVNPQTYYVAPEFNSTHDFNTAFLGQYLTYQSRIIPLTDCDDVNDGDQHYITFQPNQTDWIQHSEKKKHDRSFFGREMEKLYLESSKKWTPLDRDYAADLFDKTAEVMRVISKKEERMSVQSSLPLLDFNPRQSERKDILLRTAQILSVFVGVTLVLVGSNE